MDGVPPNWPFQFSLRHMIIAMVIVSFAFALLITPPGWVASLTVILASAFATVALTSGVIYGRDDVRAFCIGALFLSVMVTFPAAIVFITAVVDSPGALERAAMGMRVAAVVGTISVPIAGVISVVVRRRLSGDE